MEESINQMLFVLSILGMDNFYSVTSTTYSASIQGYYNAEIEEKIKKLGFEKSIDHINFPEYRNPKHKRTVIVLSKT